MRLLRPTEAIRAWSVACTTLLLGVTLVQAQIVSDTGAVDLNGPSIATSLPQNNDLSRARKWMSDHGINYTLIYTNDVLSNLSGGNKRGTIDQGLLEGRLAVDLEKLAGWHGLTMYSNVFQIHNTGRMLRDYVGGINTIAAIEALPTTRLDELWLEQKFLNGTASFKFGQLSADTEFFFSGLSTMFLQSDWPTIGAVNLPSGGPAYPLSTPGVRLKVDPTKDISLLFAVFNGDPAGPGSGDEQTRNRYGLNFRLSDPAFAITELQFQQNQGKEDSGLATTLKVGGWAHLGKFDDQRYAIGGLSLADPVSSGIPAKHSGNFGIYGVIDQQIYRPPHGEPGSGVSIYSRASLSPPDRNLIDAYIDGGIVFASLIPHRPKDSFGAGFIYAKFSNSVSGFDQDQITYTGIPGPVRDREISVEITYVAQVVSGWTVQPDLQYISHPNGQAGRDAKVVGIRSTWNY
jgi:porin